MTDLTIPGTPVALLALAGTLDDPGNMRRIPLGIGLGQTGAGDKLLVHVLYADGLAPGERVGDNVAFPIANLDLDVAAATELCDRLTEELGGDDEDDRFLPPGTAIGTRVVEVISDRRHYGVLESYEAPAGTAMVRWENRTASPARLVDLRLHVGAAPSPLTVTRPLNSIFTVRGQRAAVDKAVALFNVSDADGVVLASDLLEIGGKELADAVGDRTPTMVLLVELLGAELVRE